jgi:tyrosine-protein kinase Etk/Wzc
MKAASALPVTDETVMMEQQKIDESAGLGVQVLELLQVLAKRKRLIIFMTVITAVLSAAYSMTLPNIYIATTKVLLPQKEGSPLSGVLGQMGGLAALAGGRGGGDADLYLGILKSRSVGDAVVQRLDLTRRFDSGNRNRVWSRLDRSIKAQAGKDGIMVITAEDADPRLAALIANTVADELGRTMVRLNLSKVGSEKLFLEERLDVVKRDLKAAEEDLKSFSQINHIANVESQAGASISGASQLKTEIARKEVELAELRRSQTEESYEVAALRAGIARLKGELAANAGQGGSSVGLPALGSVPQLGLEYARKMRNLKTQEALFEQLSKQYEMAKLNQAKDSSSLQVLDEALVPEEKSRPRRSTIVAMSSLIALFCSICTAFALEYLQRMPAEEKKLLIELKAEVLSVR